ncbi:MAG TPA: HAD family hydrolase [Phycisphaerae bacterium]|nr:HAD family hydrolase [Phycisphaerae bacterium]HNU45874.1 HAD family hydrolase [Phycisphaerae bacterium]
MAGRHYDALLIDFYGTVAAGDRQAVDEACAAAVEALGLPMSADELARRWGVAFFAEMDASNGQEAFKTLRACEMVSLRRVLGDLAEGADLEPFIVQLQEYMANPPIHADALELLRDVGVPVCCVSNADNRPLFAAIRRWGLRFDDVVSSEEARSYKPDAGIFREALRRLDVRPQRALHVGDSLHSDVGGARGVGITPVWLCREDRIHDLATCAADLTVRTLTEVRALLEGEPATMPRSQVGGTR